MSILANIAPMTTIAQYLLLLLKHVLAVLDRWVWSVTTVPGEIGPDDDGAWCTGYPTGETALVFVTPTRRQIFADLDLLEEIASGSLGPSDPRLLGRVDSVGVFE